MKPSSIIALIVAVLLVIVGLTTCIIAQNMANASGQTLFSESRSDGLVNTMDLSEQDLSKIELIVSDADINIYGKSSSSYVEFVNFRENYYTLTTANQVLSFDEIPDVVSMLKFWENGFSFKGMRYIFNFRPETEGRKVINVYLNANTGINIFKITADNCTLNLEGLTWGSDYDFTLKNGEINVPNLKTTSTFRVNGEEITLNFGTAIISNLEIEANTLNLTANSLRVNSSALLQCGDGAITIGSAKDLNTLDMELTSETGVLTVDNVTYSSPFQQAVANAATVRITTASADVTLRPSSSTVSEEALGEEGEP